MCPTLSKGEDPAVFGQSDRKLGPAGHFLDVDATQDVHLLKQGFKNNRSDEMYLVLIMISMIHRPSLFSAQTRFYCFLQKLGCNKF